MRAQRDAPGGTISIPLESRRQAKDTEFEFMPWIYTKASSTAMTSHNPERSRATGSAAFRRLEESSNRFTVSARDQDPSHSQML
jgi:hypothetical protein